MLEQVFEEKMFPLTIAGLGDAMKYLKRKNN
jgi:uncharacterized protein with von Willebrand factor type A (vWA) domain